MVGDSSTDVRGRPEVRGVYIGQLDETLPARRLLESDTGAVYATSGHLLFIRDGRLMAQQFDPGRLELSGSAFPIAEGLGRSRPEPGSIGFAHRFHHLSDGLRQRSATIRMVRSVRRQSPHSGRFMVISFRAVAITGWPACRLVPRGQRECGHLDS